MGRDPRTGIRLPGYFIKAGIDAPDGTDVAGDLLPLRQSAAMGAAVYRSLLPLALKFGITTEERSRRFFGLASGAQRPGELLCPVAADYQCLEKKAGGVKTDAVQCSGWKLSGVYV